MRLAPGIFMRADIGGFAKISRTRIFARDQITRLHANPVRHAVVMVAAVVVGIRWEGTGKGIDPGTRADAVLVAVEA